MSNLRNCRGNESGQALVVVIAVVAFTAILIFALQISVTGDQQLSSISTSQEQALQAAQTGLADYQAWVNGSTNQWQYATAHCSKVAFSACTQNPDGNNLAFSGTPDPNCTGSAYNAMQGSSGDPNYFGWVTVHNDAGYVQQFQYVVDSSLVKAPGGDQPAGGGYAHVFVTGRSGRSLHFTCSTVKALYNGPQYTKTSTTVLSPVLCNGANGIIPVPAPAGTTHVVIMATGGSGTTGGVGAGSGGTGLQGVQSTGGGSGGLGATVQATFLVPSPTTTTLYVNLGCQGGTGSSTWQGGGGFSIGGSVGTPSGPGNAGGGGGSTAVCFNQPACYAGSLINSLGINTPGIISSALMASDVYLVAGGGGGGGEGRAFAAGNGGSGGTNPAPTGYPPGETNNGNRGSNSAFTTGGGSPPHAGQGGAGGQGTTSYTPAGAAGGAGQLSTSNSDGGEDGGAGGGGVAGGAGGTPGWGGGGGGVGSSFYNTSLGYVSVPVPSGTWTPSLPPPYGQVTITWENSSGGATVVSPHTCGPAGERTISVAQNSTYVLQVVGGNGGQGSIQGKDPFSNGDANSGLGVGITASYQNTSANDQDITAIEGCNGAIATGDLTATLGGFGLSNGANNNNCSLTLPCVLAGDSGSGGGGAAICVGSVAPGSDSSLNNNCCPNNPNNPNTICLGDPSDILMFAGGGGGGGGASAFLVKNPGGAGGAAGIGTNWPGGTSSTGPQVGLVAGLAGLLTAGSGGGGVGGSTPYGTLAGAGTPVPLLPCNGAGGDGGGGGGGYGGGAGGFYGSTKGGPTGCQQDSKPSSGGGGGGSSYLATTNGTLTMNQCAPYQSSQPLSQQLCMFSPCGAPGSTSPLVQNQPNTSPTGSPPLNEAQWCQGSTTFGGASALVKVEESPPSILSQSPARVGGTTW